MKKPLLISLLITFICITGMQAIPALPVKHQIMQPDGTVITVYLRGDEYMHFYETADGLMLQKCPAGFYRYADLSSNGDIVPGSYVAHDVDFRSAEENLYTRNIRQEVLRDAMMEKHLSTMAKVSQKVAPGEIRKEFPTTGEVKGLVVLAEYQNIKFTEAATQEAYDRVMNEENYTGPISSGSVRDYFLNQSGGKLKLSFDVVGPVTLAHDRAYYGSSQDTGAEKVSEMVEEAVKLAREKNPDLDFSQYDKNEDGEVDFIYVIYAGYGEAQGGPEECVWPQSASLKYISWDLYDGLYLGRYSCSCELRSNEKKELDGIGTFCHEFSHILGLPDIYDPKYSGCDGLGHWDIMDVGSYNDYSRTPAGYTAMDKYTLGWITPEILEDPQEIKLEALSTSNKAYFLVSETNPNEYFTFENRQQIGWDAALPGHGLLISHIEYDHHIWKNNMVNTAGYEHVALVAADENTSENGPGNVFPGTTGKTEFTDSSTPAMTWNSGEAVGKPITNIQEKDGIISFNFRLATAIAPIAADKDFAYSGNKSIIVTNENGDEVTIYSTDGRLIYKSKEKDCNIPIQKGIYIVHAGDKTAKVNVQ